MIRVFKREEEPKTLKTTKAYDGTMCRRLLDVTNMANATSVNASSVLITLSITLNAKRNIRNSSGNGRTYCSLAVIATDGNRALSTT